MRPLTKSQATGVQLWQWQQRVVKEINTLLHLVLNPSERLFTFM
ncbi:unnamed protein product [Strongylus vulgaris]|uniref:Uncharacterized protein n=1 Tax=Strongylus vulgaris TaxID=40348 RepID=A0A3P7JLB3_STRVU|nr:unnamed protein product [Strongylus vulgaris]VDM85014.1 unnamed protein product [Strongylus vulgaris]